MAAPAGGVYAHKALLKMGVKGAPLINPVPGLQFLTFFGWFFFFLFCFLSFLLFNFLFSWLSFLRLWSFLSLLLVLIFLLIFGVGYFKCLHVSFVVAKFVF